MWMLFHKTQIIPMRMLFYKTQIIPIRMPVQMTQILISERMLIYLTCMIRMRLGTILAAYFGRLLRVCWLSMLFPMTHGAGAKKGSVATPRSDPTPNEWEPPSNTLPQHNNTYPNNWEPLLNTLPQSNTNTLLQPVFNTESVPVFYMFVQSNGQQPTRLPGWWRTSRRASHRQPIITRIFRDHRSTRDGIPIPDR